MAQIDNFIEELKLKKQEVEVAEEIKKEAHDDVFKIKVLDLSFSCFTVNKSMRAVPLKNVPSP